MDIHRWHRFQVLSLTGYHSALQKKPLLFLKHFTNTSPAEFSVTYRYTKRIVQIEYREREGAGKVLNMCGVVELDSASRIPSQRHTTITQDYQSASMSWIPIPCAGTKWCHRSSASTKEHKDAKVMDWITNDTPELSLDLRTRRRTLATCAMLSHRIYII